MRTVEQGVMSVVLVFMLFSSVYGSGDFKRRSVYFELGGEGIGVSLNIDYRFQPNFLFRVGFGEFLLGYSIPVSFHVITNGNSNHHMEFEGGVTFGRIANIFGGGEAPYYLFTAGIGYRYQRPNGGLVFRASFTPLFIDGSEILPLAGISIGYCY